MFAKTKHIMSYNFR